MTLLANIHDYYFHHENWISISKTVLNGMIFKDGIQTPLPVADETETIKLLSDALDYRRMFGFCPIITNEDSVSIPVFGTGKFSFRVDQKTLRVIVRFVPKDDDRDGKSRQRRTDVFVWPDSEPSISGEIKSNMLKLYKKYRVIEELHTNLMDADFNASHPTIHTQLRPQNKSLDDMTESELYADISEMNNGDQSMGPQENVTYRRLIFSGDVLNRLSESFNSRSFNTKRQRTYDFDTRQFTQLTRERSWKDNKFTLSPDEELVRQTEPRSRSDFIQLNQNYQEEVSIVMGIPQRYLIGNRGFKSDSKNETQITRNSVTQNREDCQLFFHHIFNFLYGEQLGKMSTTIQLNQLDLQEGKRKQSTNDNQQELEKQLDSIKWHIEFSQNSRKMIIFNGDPFVVDIPLQEILVASDRGALTKLEEINLLRSRFSLPPVLSPHSSENSEEKNNDTDKKKKKKTQSIRYDANGRTKT